MHTRFLEKSYVKFSIERALSCINANKHGCDSFADACFASLHENPKLKV